MADRFDLLRVHPPPYGSLLYVYYSGTENEVPIFSDGNLTQSITQPVIVTDENWWFYCENTRVDIKIFHHSYENGYFVIGDMLIFNHDNVDHHIDGGDI